MVMSTSRVASSVACSAARTRALERQVRPASRATRRSPANSGRRGQLLDLLRRSCRPRGGRCSAPGRRAAGRPRSRRTARACARRGRCRCAAPRPRRTRASSVPRWSISQSTRLRERARDAHAARTCGTGRSRQVAPQPRSTTLPRAASVEHFLARCRRATLRLVGAQALDQAGLAFAQPADQAGRARASCSATLLDDLVAHDGQAAASRASCSGDVLGERTHLLGQWR